MLSLNPKTSALVLIDLQKGIVALDCAPYNSAEIVERSKVAADKFRAAGGQVVWVHVGWAEDVSDYPCGQTDVVPAYVQAGYLAPDWKEIEPGLVQEGDLVVYKRNWGAFNGTDLDLQMRRRGIDTLVFGGIGTNMGVESSARNAWKLGFNVVVAEDLSTSFASDMHQFACEKILPRISRVVKADDLVLDVG